MIQPERMFLPWLLDEEEELPVKDIEISNSEIIWDPEITEIDYEVPLWLRH